MAKGSETEVKHLLHHFKVEESSQATATVAMNKMVLKEIARSGSTEVKHMLNHLKVEESILAAATVTMKKMA